MSSKTERNIKRAITVLSVLLLISGVLLLGSFYYYKRVAPTVVPDNTISIGKSVEKVNLTPRKTEVLMMARTAANEDERGTLWKSSDESVLKLYKGQSYDETSFAVTNMFPGDEVSKEYLVQVRHKGTVTVHFTSNVHPTSDPPGGKLEDVLMCKVEVDGEEVYKGLMRDMPTSLDYSTPGVRRAATTEIPYKITAYLDGPKVGNSHMNKSLIADFQWWVLVDQEEETTGGGGGYEPGGDYEPGGSSSEDEDIAPELNVKGEYESDSEEGGYLAVLPMTGDNTIWIMVTAAATSILLVILLLGRRRKEDEHGL